MEQCPVCSQSYPQRIGKRNRKITLKNHMFAYHSIDPEIVIRCEFVYCNKRFLDQAVYQQHVEDNHKYQCYKCLISFGDEDKFKVHSRVCINVRTSN